MADPVSAQIRHRPRRDDTCLLSQFGQIDLLELRVRVRRAQHHEPCLAGKLAVVAKEPLASEEPVIFETLLRARRAKARRRGIELDLQRNGGHSGIFAESKFKLMYGFAFRP